MAKTEGDKVGLQPFVNTHSAIICNDKQLLVLRPAKSLNRSLIPLYGRELDIHSPWIGHRITYIHAANKLPSATVNINARLGRLCTPVCLDLLFISVEGYLPNISIHRPP
jgi:hypothetical protein